jgi:hypothetical protein
VRQEVEILHLLSPHENIANIAGVYEDKRAVHIIME